MKEIRFHGRGGQGAVTAAELFAQAAISSNLYAQGFPNFGAERRGAPVMAFLRVSDSQIFLRERIEEPDVVVVLDSTLIGLPEVTPGPAFIHVFSPCPTGWKMPTSGSIDVCKLAVKTNMYPLFEIIDGKHTLGSINKKPLPVVEYLKIQGRFKHLSQHQIESIQHDVDKRYEQLVRLASSS